MEHGCVPSSWQNQIAAPADCTRPLSGSRRNRCVAVTPFHSAVPGNTDANYPCLPEAANKSCTDGRLLKCWSGTVAISVMENSRFFVAAVPIFDLPINKLYAVVLRSVSSADRPDRKNGLYGSAETSAPRSGFICFKTTAAQLMADAVSAANSSFSKLRHYLVRFSGIASVFSYMIPTNPGTAVTSPTSMPGGTELRLFLSLDLSCSRPTNRQVQLSRRITTIRRSDVIRSVGELRGAFWRIPLRPFSSDPPTTYLNRPGARVKATGFRGAAS